MLANNMSPEEVSIQAIILAGGKGTRLASLYPSIPKSLVPVAGKPFIQRQLEWLAAKGVTCVRLATGHLSDCLDEWLAGAPLNSLSITISREQVPLGTAGAMKLAARSIIGDPFLVLNGDTLLPRLNLEEMIESHERSGAALSLAVVRIQSAGRYGAVRFDESGRITAFLEKADRSAGWVNGGAYLVNHRALEHIDSDRCVSIESEVFPTLAKTGALKAFPCLPPLLDMGTPEGIEEMEGFLAS